MKLNTRISEPQWWLVIVIAFVAIFGAGKIEGNLFPAAAPMKLTKIIVAPPLQNNLLTVAPKTGFYIWGYSSRLRSDCAFRDLKLYLGERDGQTVPLRIELEPSKLRDDGRFFFGPWWVESQTMEQFKERTFADVLHQCKTFGVPHPWLTISKFWN